MVEMVLPLFSFDNHVILIDFHRSFDFLLEDLVNQPSICCPCGLEQRV